MIMCEMVFAFAITNTTWQREKAAGNSSNGLLQFLAPHTGQSSLLFIDANDGNAQFLPKLAGAVVWYLRHKA